MHQDFPVSEYLDSQSEAALRKRRTNRILTQMQVPIPDRVPNQAFIQVLIQNLLSGHLNPKLNRVMVLQLLALAL